jgi:hypothetical protein
VTAVSNPDEGENKGEGGSTPGFGVVSTLGATSVLAGIRMMWNRYQADKDSK